MPSPDPVSGEQFLGWVVFLIKTYFWLALGIFACTILMMGGIIAFFMWRKRKRLAKLATDVAEGLSQLID